MLLEFSRVNVEYLLATSLVGKFNFNVNLKSAWPKDGLIQEILSVGHANQQYVVQSINSIDVG